MSLSAITKGKIAQPHRLVLYGPDGIGKSTFAADAPSPIFLGAEDGTAELNTSRLPQPRRWSDVGDAIRLLVNEDHQFETFVIDTLDWLEPLCHSKVAADFQETCIEAIGFGVGINQAVKEWRKFCAGLEHLQEKKAMNVILLAHTNMRTFKNPQGPAYDRYELKLHHKSSALMREWAKNVLFANYETYTDKDKRTKRVRGISTGHRIMHTVYTAAYDAKNRLSLPDCLPLSWADYQAACDKGRVASDKDLTEAIEALLQRAPADLVAKVRPTMRDKSKLAQIHNRLLALLPEEEEQRDAS